MTNSHKLSKGILLRWLGRVQDYLKAQAEARRAHMIAVWGNGETPAAWELRPDATYRFMRTAWGRGGR